MLDVGAAALLSRISRYQPVSQTHSTIMGDLVGCSLVAVKVECSIVEMLFQGAFLGFSSCINCNVGNGSELTLLFPFTPVTFLMNNYSQM